MKANSDTNPGQFTNTHGKLFFNYNIIESQKTDEHGTRTVFDYDYIEVKKTNIDDIKKTLQAANRAACDNHILSRYSGKIQDSFNAGVYSDVATTAYKNFLVACIAEENRVFDLIEPLEELSIIPELSLPEV